MKKLKILIADDHEMIRQGLCALVKGHRGWDICGEAVTGREAVEKALELRPDIVVMDIAMPELNGLDATRQIRRQLPDTQIVVLSMYDTEQLVQDVLAAGARGYVLKSDAGTTLVTAIESLAKGEPFFSYSVADQVLRTYWHTGEPTGSSPDSSLLTGREREILQLIAEGKSSRAVAEVLKISPKTVEVHRANMMRKLQMHSTGQLVLYAVRNKIVQV